MEVNLGDKVRLTPPGCPASRGIVQAVIGTKIAVQIEGSGEVVEVPANAVTNFSAAARKAWQTRPRRNVGRPKGSRTCDRVSVTLRIDRELWKEFLSNEASGVIAERTGTINRWLREKLDQLEAGKDRTGGHADQ